MIPKILNAIGIIGMVAVIFLALPLTLPRLLGYQIYGIATGSMEPEISTGSAVYVKEAQPADIQKGDIITYRMGTDTSMMTTHRVAEIDMEKQQFITKGDANASEDVYPVAFDRLMGKVAFAVPMLGTISLYLHSSQGKLICAGIFIFCGALWMLAERMKKLKES